jgi:PilZ domain
MRVSADVIEEIIGHRVGSLCEQGNNRRSCRIAVSKRATLTHIGSAIQIPITVVNVSAGGVGFIYSSPLVPGELFTLRITGQDGDGVTVECSVRWHMKTGSGRCRIGAEFIRLIDEETNLQPSEAGCA